MPRRDVMFHKNAKAKRAKALERSEFMYPTGARESAAGVTSAAIKVEDAENRRLIDEALARRAAR